MRQKPLPVQTWTGVPFDPAAGRNSRSLEHIPGRVSAGGQMMNRYALGFVFNFLATLTPDDSQQTIPSLDTLADALINSLTITHLDGALCETLSGSELVWLMAAEGCSGSGKANGLIIFGAIEAANGDSQEGQIQLTLIVPFAPQFFSSGSTRHAPDDDQGGCIEGGMVMPGIMGGQCLITWQPGTLPAGWTSAAGITCTVDLWVHETPRTFLPRPSMLMRHASTEDPARLPVAKPSKVETLIVMGVEEELSVWDSTTVLPRYVVDGDDVIGDQLSAHQLNVTRAAVRDDSNRYAAMLAGSQTTILIILDPFQADRFGIEAAGSEHSVYNVANGEGAKVKYLLRRYAQPTVRQINEALVAMGVPNPANLKGRMTVQGEAYPEALVLTEGELLGQDVEIDADAHIPKAQ